MWKAGSLKENKRERWEKSGGGRREEQRGLEKKAENLRRTKQQKGKGKKQKIENKRGDKNGECQEE